MLQIEEWFRRPQRKTERKITPPAKTVMPAVHNKPEETHAEAPKAPAAEQKQPEPLEPEAVPVKPVVQTVDEPEPDIFEPEEAVSLADTVEETEQIDRISEGIGLDVADLMDLEKGDILIRQIDEFREKAKQLQKLMLSRESKAKELQSVVDKKEAQASELDDLISVRQGEAERIMGNVAEKIDSMSSDVRQEMTGLSDAVSREVSGLSQNITQEISQSAEKTRQAVENATQTMIDQNTRSLEGLKEQLEQLGHLEQIGELSTEMNSQIITLKSDIVEKIHSEDVKCYRNIQASMEEQGKTLAAGEETTRQYVQEQMEGMEQQLQGLAKFLKISLGFAVLNFIGIIGILICVILL